MNTRMRLFPLWILVGMLALAGLTAAPAGASQVQPTPSAQAVIPPPPMPSPTPGPTATPPGSLTPAEAGRIGSAIIVAAVVLAVLALVFSFFLTPSGRTGPPRP